MIFKIGELFCGPGGLGLGAKKAIVKKNNEIYKIKHAWATDYHKDSCETYRRNICQNNPDIVICENVHKLNLDILKPIDAFMYGFPCNDFSTIGKRNGMKGKFGPLYYYGVKILEKFSPKWFLAENVAGLKSTNNGRDFKKILSDLSKAGTGYNLTVHLYKCENYGIPQSRHRIIIVGIRKDFDMFFQVPKPSFKIVTCKEALENPPIPEGIPNHEKPKMQKKSIEKLKYIKPGENLYTANIPEHLSSKTRKINSGRNYKRLDPNKPSNTILANAGGGMNLYHWKENRTLTNRERARLQTFPDDFVFYGSKGSVRRQIGMSVPVKIAQIIVESILKCFANIDYETIIPSIGYFKSSFKNYIQKSLF